MAVTAQKPARRRRPRGDRLIDAALASDGRDAADLANGWPLDAPQPLLEPALGPDTAKPRARRSGGARRRTRRSA
jgi:hypothetical protein